MLAVGGLNHRKSRRRLVLGRAALAPDLPLKNHPTAQTTSNVCKVRDKRSPWERNVIEMLLQCKKHALSCPKAVLNPRTAPSTTSTLRFSAISNVTDEPPTTRSAKR